MGRKDGPPSSRGARPAARRPRARRYHHGDLPRALLDAALALIERHGVDGLTLRAVAHRAGVSEAAPYRHFADKGALLAAVAEEGFRAMAEGMRRAAQPEADPVSRFRSLGLAYVDFAQRRPAHFRVMFGREIADRSRYPSLKAAALEAFGLLSEAIADCQRAGFVRPGEPHELALTAWAAVHGLSALLVDGQLGALYAAGPADLAERVTAALFFGLAMTTTWGASNGPPIPP